MVAATAPVLLALLAQGTPTSTSSEPIRGGEAHVASWREHRQRSEASPFRKRAWRPLGPKNCGGRIESVDSPRGLPSVIYAGVGSGGVWKSVNGGLTWEHVFAEESSFAVGDVTVDPSDPQVVWVGTGEAHLGGMSYDGTGVFRSGDGGETWKHMGLVDSARISQVLVDERDGDTVHVGVIGPRGGEHRGRGVHVSRDGGVTWELTLFAGDRVGIIDLVRDPFDGDRLWAAGWDRSRKGDGGVFRSEDNGATWQRLEGGLLQGSDVGRIALAASASQQGVVYALIVDHSPPGEGRYDVGGALFRSDDGGETWRRTSEEYVDTYVGWDFCDVRVSPDQADEVYVCGMRLMVSRDGGASFERGGETVFRLLDHPGRGMHLDMHDLWIDPENPDRVLLGTDGGLYVSMDRARSWLHLNNLPIAEFYEVHLDDQRPFHIWGGTQDNASLTVSSQVQLDPTASDQWSYVFLDRWDGGDGFSTFPDPSGDGTQYYEQQNGSMTRKDPGAGLRWGETTHRITPKSAEGEPGLRFAWNAPLLSAPTSPGVLLCASQYVHRSEDRGDSWTRISEDLTGGRGAVASLSASPLDGQRMVAGSGWGRVSCTADGGATWELAGDGLPSRRIQRVLASRHGERRIYVCLSGQDDGDTRAYLFRSDDFGSTWRDLASNLPNLAVNVVVEDPQEDQVLYLGNDLGVYASLDDGLTWLSLSYGLPSAPVVDLAVDAETGTLVAVTHGLSAFSLDISDLRHAPADQR